MPVNATDIQDAIVRFLGQKRLVDGWLSVEVCEPHEREGGRLEGELFLSRRFHEGVNDDDLGRACAALSEGFATGEIKVPGAARVEARATDGFFNERSHPELGTVRTLAAWLVVTPE